MKTIVSLISLMSDTIHILQQERGSSVGYISSDGKKFKLKLEKIRKNTDLKKEKLFLFFNSNCSCLDKYIKQQDRENIKLLFNDIEMLRANVSELRISFSKTYSKYTQLITFLLLNISNISEEIQNDEINNRLYTYAILLMHKESIGQKRAALSRLFSQKKFSQETYEYFLTADTQEKIYLKMFLHNVNDDTKKLYLKSLNTQATKEVKKYEGLAFRKLKGESIDADPHIWFENITKKINLVQDVEHKVLNDILFAVEKEKKLNLKNTKKLKIAFNFDRPPYMFGESSSKGIESDLIKEILQSRGYKVEISQMSKEYLENVLNSKNDIDGVSAVSVKNKQLFYTDDFVSFTNYAITRKYDNIKIDSIEDLAKINFVSWKGAYNDLGKDFYNLFNPINGSSKFSYSDSSSQIDSIEKFLRKDSDAIVIDKTIFKWYKLKYKNNDEFTYHHIFPKTTYFPAVFRSKKVRDEFNIGLRELKKSGRYDEIVTFYLEQDIQALLDYSNLIANLSGRFMFEGKDDKLKTILKEFFRHPDIVCIEVFNKSLEHSFLTLCKKDNLIIEAKNNDYSLNYPSIRKNIYFSNKGTPLHIGMVNIFYKKSFKNDKKGLIPSLSSFVGLDKEDKEKLVQSYKNFGLNAKNIELTEDEKEWIKQHPIIKFTGDPDWLPFEAFDKHGNYIGIVSRYLNTLELLTGIKFERVKTLSWSESVRLSEDRDIDVLSDTTESNRKNLIFTKPYIKNDIVIVMSKEHKYVEGLGDIKNDKIALIKDYGYIDQIKKTYPYINFLSVDTVNEGLSAVSTGKIDALVCTFALGSYATTNMGISNIKIIGKTQFTTSLGLGVRDDYITLVNILDKAIDSISQKEHNEIFNHWIKQEYVEKVDYSLSYKVAGGALVLILISVVWIRKMASEINKRKEAQAEVKASEEKFISMVSNVPGVIYRCLLDKEWTMLYVSNEIENLSGYPASDYLNNNLKTFADFVHPDDTQRVSTYIQHQLDIGEAYTIDYKIICRDGSVRWVRGGGKASYTDENSIGWLDGVIYDITSQKNSEQELEEIHQHTKESIEYASLIQSALIPNNKVFRSYFQDYFAIWHPKDIVGGDIYLFEELRDADECLIMVIDCTGHGVPGAFVTMLVKAIERQIIAKINNDLSIDVSPAWILNYFNRKVKVLLNQEDKNSVSNAGFDGAVIYYNKKGKIFKFAGAEIPLFYVEDEELKTIKGDRYSVGYKKCDKDHQYKEHTVKVKEGMQFYISTDGYFDQNGGEKSFPFGKKAFKNIIYEYSCETMADQQEVFLNKLDEYQGDEETNDDITLIGFKI
ncbi:MAG: transporter substrate-binding domain-containing protein [Sulfurimonas sp.]|nr:transporter substrate-binding domain-containing protein [Sulfurimonas sp.]